MAISVGAGAAGRKGGDPWVQYISLKAKRRKKQTRKLRSGILPERNTNKELSMYR
jgi:hypothetical protein